MTQQLVDSEKVVTTDCVNSYWLASCHFPSTCWHLLLQTVNLLELSNATTDW